VVQANFEAGRDRLSEANSLHTLELGQRAVEGALQAGLVSNQQFESCPFVHAKPEHLLSTLLYLVGSL
jgi:hypothetical protein